jgi:hypothetical protein
MFTLLVAVEDRGLRVCGSAGLRVCGCLAGVRCGVGCRLWPVVCGVCAVVCVLWGVACGVCAAGRGLWAMLDVYVRGIGQVQRSSGTGTKL